MTPPGRLGRALGRRGEASDGSDAIARADAVDELRNALKKVSRRGGEPQPVQLAGQPMMPPEYARWREAKLRRGAIMNVPEGIDRRSYALVLFAVDPTGTDDFRHYDAGGLVTPPTVRLFLLGVQPQLALAATITGWLERYSGPVALAPPLLSQGGQWRVADLGLNWPIAAYSREYRPRGSA